jgi:CMP-N-acetylneuraminic acid synthetase
MIPSLCIVKIVPGRITRSPMDKETYKKFHDHCEMAIKGSAIALTPEQKEQVVHEVYCEMGLKYVANNPVYQEMKTIFRNKVL